MDWSSSPTANTLPWAPSIRTSSYWARLVSWNSSTITKAKRSRHQASRSGCSRNRVRGWSIRSSKSIAFWRRSAAARGSMSSAAIWARRSNPAEAASSLPESIRFLAEEITAWTARAGKSLGEICRSSSSRLISASRSSSSKMVNWRENPSRSASRRSSRAERLWKVPIQSPVGSRSSRVATRCFISAAALLVKVTAKIRSGGTPCSSSSTASRVMRTRVFPEPAPASTSSGPFRWATASRCSAFRVRAQSRPVAPAVISARPKPVRSQIGPEDRGNPDRAVGGLVVLQDGRDGPGEGDSGGVQGVDELRLGTRGGTEAYVGAPGLEVGEGAGAGALQPGLDSRGPHLEVVGARRAVSGVAAGQLRHPVGQLQAAEHRLGVAGEQGVLRFAGVGSDEPDQLDLVELVYPEQPAGVFPRGARLAAKAGSERHIGERQHPGFENLVAVQVGDRNFSGGNQEQIVPGRGVEVILELGELPGAGECGARNQEGRRDLQIPVLGGVEVEHEARQCAHQSRPGAPEDRKSRTGDLAAPGQVENAERFSQLPMGAGCEVEGRRLAPALHHPVLLGGSGGDLWVGEVGQPHQEVAELLFQLAGFGVERPGPIGRGLELSQQIVGGFPGALLPGDFLGLGISLGAERFALGHHPAPPAVEVEHLIHALAEGRVHPAQQRAPRAVGILPQHPHVNHCLGSPSSSPRYPQFTLISSRKRTECSVSLKPSIWTFA